MKVWLRLLLDWLLPVAAVLAVAVPNLDHAPSYDEVLHYDAAIGILEHGDVTIAQGRYERAALYTNLVAASFGIFGVNDTAARIPSVIASVGWALLLYGFVRRYASRSAAWLALALFVAAPTFIQITQTCRFYTLHGFTFFVAALALFAAVQSRSSARRVGFSVLCLVFLAISWHLQLTTLIGIAGLLAWLVTLSLPGVYGFLAARRGYAVAAGLVAAGALVAAYFVLPWSRVVEMALHSPYWSQGTAASYLFYARSLKAEFEFVWVLFPFLAVIGYRRLPAVVWYACVIFATAFVLHSLAGAKADRYIAYAFPFVCIVAGVALADMLGTFRLIAIDVWQRTAGVAGSERAGGAAVVVLCVALAVLVNPNTSNAVLGIADADASGLAEYYAREPDWRRASDALSRETGGSPTLVASSGTKALFYVGYYDYELNVSVVYETNTNQEFGTDERTGGLVIGALESLQQVVSCSPRGLIVADETKWRVPAHVAPNVAEYVEQTMQPVTVPPQANLRVYAWTSPPNDSAACERLPRSRSTMRR